MTANQILGNSDYPMIAYSGFRGKSRDVEPTMEQIKEDLQLLAWSGYKVVKTYDLQHEFASNVLKAIKELKAENENFEMYVMIGTWIECHNAWTPEKDHSKGNTQKNSDEINKAIELAHEYSDIVKIISIGNEARVHWSHWDFVQPKEILNWIKVFRVYIDSGYLDSDLWITSSDNYAAWGGEEQYQSDDLIELINAVDYISVHVYPYITIGDLPEGIDLIENTFNTAINHFMKVKEYLNEIGVDKAVHIGETGWATKASNFLSDISNEENQAAYHDVLKNFAKHSRTSICLFSAFDEQWKCEWDADDHENNFGIFNLDRTLKGAGR